jgi:hypothetical protein
MFVGLLSNVCLGGHPYKLSYRLGIEIWSYTKRGQNVDEQFWIYVLYFKVL